MVVDDQHVHISVKHLPEKPAGDAKLAAFTMVEAAPKWDNRYHEHQRRLQPCSNNTYPLEWRSHYTTQTVKENEETEYLSEMIPEQRIVWASGSHMTRLSTVCRQIYDEVGLISYSTNEFSFCSPYEFEKWLRARLLPQRQAITILWLDNE
jgi:hypothetical protein